MLPIRLTLLQRRDTITRVILYRDNKSVYSGVYLVYIDPVIQGPHCLKVVLHSLFQFFGDLVQYEKILEIPQFRLIQRSSRVNSLNNRRHVTEHHSMHQSCSIYDTYSVEIFPTANLR